MADEGSVYVIDDEESIRDSLQFLLSLSGYHVRCFASGERFLAQREKLRPGVVLLDLHLPKLDGFAILRELDRQANRFPAIVMSGQGNATLTLHSIRAGAVDFLEKPFERTPLVRSLDRAMQRMGAESVRPLAQAKQVLSELDDFEHDLLAGLCAEMSERSLMELLSINADRFANVRAEVLRKLGADNLAQALRVAFDAGFPWRPLPVALEPSLFDWVERPDAAAPVPAPVSENYG